MEARSRSIQHDDFDFALATRDYGAASDPSISARMFRTDFDETSGLQSAGKSAGVFTGPAGTRRGISRHARTRAEAICRFAAERWDASLLARWRHGQWFRELPGLVVGE